LGDVTFFAWRTLMWLLVRLPRRGTLLPVMYQVGVLSLPVVALTGMFIGMVLAVQTFYEFHRLQMETRLGAVINMSLARELGPVLAATMLAGRVGSAMAAELAPCASLSRLMPCPAWVPTRFTIWSSRGSSPLSC